MDVNGKSRIMIMTPMMMPALIPSLLLQPHTSHMAHMCAAAAAAGAAGAVLTAEQRQCTRQGTRDRVASTCGACTHMRAARRPHLPCVPCSASRSRLPTRVLSNDDDGRKGTPGDRKHSSSSHINSREQASYGKARAAAVEPVPCVRVAIVLDGSPLPASL